ncbi:MAG: undecaprenyl/decaprenyl-phosphate alpha-N-acetylglucosaminyl 1-phosphate transferase [Spirochaetales bacterium]|nr:undecaprenyl/decaprenyl-phosphate alpha-N-acetylglucosaminyl 1-phosphate transferase [Spirochaetales bacterium]
MIYATAAVIAGIIDVFALPLVLAVAYKRAWFDRKDERKIHTGDIPRLGGVGIAFSAMIAFVATAFWIAPAAGQPLLLDPRTLILLGGFVAVTALGLVDDFLNLQARWELAAQVAVSAVVIAAGYSFRRVDLPFGLAPLELGIAGPFLTLLWLVGVMNAMNLIDGLDGLAGGIAAIGAGAYAFMAYRTGDAATGLLACAVLGAAIGFLFYNFPPASIFMGDSGSMFLGFAVGILPLSMARHDPAAPNLVIGVTVALVPILDTASSILRRLRMRVPFYTPDRLHLHHKLLGFGLPGRHILALVYTVSIALATAAVSITYLDQGSALALMYGSWFAVAALFLVSHFLKRSGFAIRRSRRDGV